MEKTDGELTGFEAELKQLADTNKIQFGSDYSAGVFPRSYLPSPELPAKWAHIGIATAWTDTPAELIDTHDLDALKQLLNAYVGAAQTSGSGGGVGSGDESGARGTPGKPPSTLAILAPLVEVYGVSNHEGPVRDLVKTLLPKWAKPETDDAGNLILHLGTAPEGSKAPRILVVAHMDEIGFAVKSISKDGRLEVEWRGGGELSFFAGHPALVHTGEGRRARCGHGVAERVGHAGFQVAGGKFGYGDSRGRGRAHSGRSGEARNQGRRHDHDSERLPAADRDARKRPQPSTTASGIPR